MHDDEARRFRITAGFIVPPELEQCPFLPGTYPDELPPGQDLAPEQAAWCSERGYGVWEIVQTEAVSVEDEPEA